MKKVLVLLSVLALVAMANAMVLSISSDITGPLLPSDTINLGVEADGFAQGDGAFWGIIVASGPGSVSGGVVVMPPAPDASMILDPADYADLAEMFGYAGASSVFGSIDTFQASPSYTAPGGLYFDEILFHCDGEGDVLVLLVTTIDFEEYVVADSLVISQQIPEPMTIALLGLGGLLLRKRS